MATAIHEQVTQEQQAHLVRTMHDRSVSARARAQMLTYKVVEAGLDLVPALETLITENDEARELKEKYKEERPPLSPEIFLGQEDYDGATYASVTNGPLDICLPCSAEEIEGLEIGDAVLVDVKNGRLAGRNGMIPRSGDVVTVESTPSPHRNGVVVKHHDQPVLARLPAKLGGPDCAIGVGTRVVYDPIRRFVYERIEGNSDGTELLTPLEQLDEVSRDQIGAVHPVVDEILFLATRYVRFPEWVVRMKARKIQSYLFCGPTGTGKSLTLKVLAKENTDFGESLSGQRVSRLVMVDAATFYSPLFGQTEANIASFFDRLRTLGRAGLRDKNGRLVPVPLLVVLEEAEALLRGRGEMGGSAHLFDRPLALILQKLSSVAGELGVPAVFITTTNRPDLLDPAAKRRLGIRVVLFGTLGAGQTASVLEKKIPPGLPLRNVEDYPSEEDARRAAINRIVAYLHGNEPEQGIAEAQMQDGQRRIVCRRELVTGAQLEEAVSKATDECLQQSAQVGRLLGLDADGVIRSLESQYAGLASLMRPHNLAEYCPHWFAGEPLRVVSVRPLRHARRPRATLIA